MRTSFCPGFLMILAVAGACKAAVAAASSTSVKLSILSGRPVVSQVFLNGRGPYRFLLDTGAQTNQVDVSLARKLGLTATFQVELETAAGATRAKGGRVGRVSLGPAEAVDQEFLFTDLDGLHALSPDLRGILGQQFLAHFDFTLDFHDHRLIFGETPGGTPGGTLIPAHLVYGRMAVSTSLGELVLDSGTDSLILFRSPANLASDRIRSTSGLWAPASREHAGELRIGDRIFHVVSTTVGGGGATREAGLLPASLFHAIFISNSAGYVVVDPANTPSATASRPRSPKHTA